MKFHLPLCLLLFLHCGLSLAQEHDTLKTAYHFRGNISVTQNGMSLIPAFSLGKPAAIAELSLGGERLSFDPEIRFDLNGQPWSFILWWRYQLNLFVLWGFSAQVRGNSLNKGLNTKK